TKEGEVVTEDQIREYEKQMKAKGVGVPNAQKEEASGQTDEASAPQAAPSASAAAEGTKAKTRGKASAKAESSVQSLAMAASEDKPTPEELF
ncbi:MAG: hypothetical protein II611_00165, partial [Treponema sp.]|nr:hypothetical protein [Treponema sp.]